MSVIKSVDTSAVFSFYVSSDVALQVGDPGYVG
jgi:hypothetical protein